MATIVEPQANPVSCQILEHMLEQIDRTPSCDEPYSHIFFEQLFPDDIYAEMMAAMPCPRDYRPLSLTKHQKADGTSTRDVLPLNAEGLSRMSESQRQLWSSVADALTAPELKSVVFSKLATDLARRFHCRPQGVDRIVSYTRPSLFRDLEGYEIAPHPDGRAKIVTMQIYLPADRSQLGLGTAVYRRRLKSLAGLYDWRAPVRASQAVPLSAQQRLRVCRVEFAGQEELARPRRDSGRLRRAEFDPEHLLRRTEPDVLRPASNGACLPEFAWRGSSGSYRFQFLK